MKYKVKLQEKEEFIKMGGQIILDYVDYYIGVHKAKDRDTRIKLRKFEPYYLEPINYFHNDIRSDSQVHA